MDSTTVPPAPVQSTRPPIDIAARRELFKEAMEKIRKGIIKEFLIDLRKENGEIVTLSACLKYLTQDENLPCRCGYCVHTGSEDCLCRRCNPNTAPVGGAPVMVNGGHSGDNNDAPAPVQQLIVKSEVDYEVPEASQTVEVYTDDDSGSASMDFKEEVDAGDAEQIGDIKEEFSDEDFSDHSSVFNSPDCSKLTLGELVRLPSPPRPVFDALQSALPDVKAESESESEPHQTASSVELPAAEPAKKFTCTVCAKGYTMRTNLTRHMKSHRNPKTTYDCEHCGKGFNEKRSLAEHVRAKVCLNKGKKSKREKRVLMAKSSPMKKKMKVTKKTEPNMAVAKMQALALVNKQVATPNGKKLQPKVYYCEMCPKQYTDKYSLQRHIITGHSDVRAFRCGRCGETFALRWSLVRHQKKGIRCAQISANNVKSESSDE